LYYLSSPVEMGWDQNKNNQNQNDDKRSKT